MAVSLPTAADVRKVREQAVKAVNQQAELARTPLLAVLGATDAAATAVTEAIAKARARAAESREALEKNMAAQAEKVQGNINELPNRLNGEELRKSVDAVTATAKQTYAQLAERGEQTWAKLREQPQVARVLKGAQDVSGRLEVRIDELVDDVHDAAEDALGRITRTARSTGEKVAQRTQRFAGEAAEKVAEAGDQAAEAVVEAGDEAAHTARSASRKAANRTQPRKTNS